MRPMSRPLSNPSGTPTAVEPNTLVVGVDFGKKFFPWFINVLIGSIANQDRQGPHLLVRPLSSSSRKFIMLMQVVLLQIPLKFATSQIKL